MNSKVFPGIIILLFSLFLVSCNISSEPDGKSSKDLEQEIASISTSIYTTIQAKWTPTPVPEKPTFTPETVPSITNTITIMPTEPVEQITEVQTIESTVPAALITPVIPLQLTRPADASVFSPYQQLDPANWGSWPIVPEISDNAVSIYWKGVNEFGTNPHYLSKVGDCHSEPNVFLGIYDTDFYVLAPENQQLETAIQFFKGSFETQSLAVHSGMSVASVLTTTWADTTVCETGENALDCEIRLHNPSIMFINLGSNWIDGVGMDVYYDYLSEIISTLTARGILPILTSKADNIEGGNLINQTTAEAAKAYDIPFFNFWQAAQYIPNKGIDTERQDGVHLSVEAWNWRNFYALETLYAFGVKAGLFQ